MLGRRTPGDPASPQNASDPAAVPGPRANGTGTPVNLGKGRPTPKRREAEKKRAPVAAPTNRREAARQSRQQSAIKRNDARKALVAGDERALPARDRGPIRRYVRDWVDGKRNLAEFLLPGIIVFYFPTLLTSGTLRNTFSYLLTAVVVVMAVELTVLVTLLSRAINREFPAGGAGRKGALRYGAMRLAAIRMFRLPKPAVKRGQEPRPINR
ncbi:MAG: hypothetical protein QOE76_4093 [Frankiales bacterium]|nr:hypothetical protein [Frankiales bacterium]